MIKINAVVCHAFLVTDMSYKNRRYKYLSKGIDGVNIGKNGKKSVGLNIITK